MARAVLQNISAPVVRAPIVKAVPPLTANPVTRTVPTPAPAPRPISPVTVAHTVPPTAAPIPISTLLRTSPFPVIRNSSAAQPASAPTTVQEDNAQPPILAPTTPPTSPISGQPIQTSIFQPTATPSLITAQTQTPNIQLTGSNYSEPPTTFSPQQAQPSIVPNLPAVATDNLPGGLNQNTWLVILALVAVIVVLVMQ